MYWVLGEIKKVKKLFLAILIMAGMLLLMGCPNQFTLENRTYTVTYNGNGNTSGSVPSDSNAYEAGAMVTVLGNTGSLVRTGYTFAGWNTAASGFGTNRAIGSTFEIGSSNVTLYAKWTANPIVTSSFSENFSGSTALVLDSFELPAGLYKIAVNTTGYFQLFDVNNNKTILNLSLGQAVNAETFIKSNGGNYLFRTANISSSWSLSFTNIDFSNPEPISNMNTVSESVPKLLGPYLMNLTTYKITMKTNGFFQLFPISSVTGAEGSYIFNEFSGNYGAQNTYSPPVQIMLFRTDNVTESYGLDIAEL